MAAIAVCAANVVPLHAAEIREGSWFGEMVLEGEIEAGDSEKFKRFIDENQSKAVYLASPGGNLAEAIEIGRIVRVLKLETIAPGKLSSDHRKTIAARHKLKTPEANYMCASACFFVFVAGVHRVMDIHAALVADEVILGIHRPFLTDSDLRKLSANQAIASANQLRKLVESYLKEMSVPAKYADLMFSVPKDQVRWIGSADFQSDLEGFIPELKDWMDAQCDKRTDAEKVMWEAIKDKSGTEKTFAEKKLGEMLGKKMSEKDECEDKTLSNLSHQAYLKMFLEPRRDAYCSDDYSDGYSDAKVAAAIVNEASAAAILDTIKSAGFCGDGDNAKRGSIVRALAERGDARAQFIIGIHYFTYSHVSPDAIGPNKLEALKWFRRAADQGNTDAQDSLSSILYFGEGVPHNYVEALKWTTLLISRNNDKSYASLRDGLASKMTPEQIADAQRLASQWRPMPERDNRERSSTPKPPQSITPKPPWWQFWK
jgi:hypothetical protein